MCVCVYVCMCVYVCVREHVFVCSCVYVTAVYKNQYTFTYIGISIISIIICTHYLQLSLFR